ncbi:MAG TPA: rRNA maturation RNase YbeY, partial [Bacteroidales bacterium]|nr:rRNA maturation RNase YbeY [Bacteroidales bacterium]
FYEEVKYRIRNSRELKKYIEKVIREERKVPGDLNFILTNDEKVKRINSEFMGRNYTTDVIAFNYNEGKTINGEIYVSLETVFKNSKIYGVSLRKEVMRVIIHGVLHLCGYNDKEISESIAMKEKEEKYLNDYIG